MRWIRDAYAKEFSFCTDGKEEMINDLVLMDLKKMRLDNLISMTSAIPGHMGNDQPIAPHVLLRYYNELASGRMKLYHRAKALFSESTKDSLP